jgi:3-methyladenine DNA glycosylase/8-oxoguanine DNA glycosylase
MTVPAATRADGPGQGDPGQSGPGRTAPGRGTPGQGGTSQDGLSRDWLAPFPLDVRLVLAAHRRGAGDPALHIDSSGAIWRTSLTPAGPGTLRVTARPAAAGSPPGPDSPGSPEFPEFPDSPGRPGTWVTARAWGPGAAWLLAALPDLLGGSDQPAGFRPAHPVLRDLVALHPGARIGRSGRVLEALVPAVLEQKVVGLEAFRAWRLLLRRFGLPAPGPAPAGLRVCPPAATWAAIPSWEWHRAGVEGVRAATIRGAARVAGRLEQILALPAPEADRRLRSLPGIGPWTSAEVRQRACGDADAVSVGDYNLPAAVGWALAGRAVDDAGMLELLAPYPGHRHRAARLIELSGMRPPRRGPRMPVRDYRAI